MFTLTSSVRLADLAGIQYIGNGYSRSCLDAVRRLVQYREEIEKVDVLTCDNSHALLLHIEREGVIAVKAGFSSGYNGEGPRTLAEVLELLEAVQAPIYERQVSLQVMERLEASALTKADLSAIDSAMPMTRRIYDYIHPYSQSRAAGRPLASLDVTMPWPLIDDRLIDLASAFFDDPDDALHKGFRRLEDVVRTRTGLNEHGRKLFSLAFGGDQSPLVWAVPDAAEQVGRAQMFIGAIMTYRNPRAHREDDSTEYQEPLREFLVLNELFCLERTAVGRRPLDRPR